MSFRSEADPAELHSRSRQVVVVEDVEGHWFDVDRQLRDAFPWIATQRVATEKNFREYLKALRPEDTPDLFVVDMMLRWTDPEPGLKDPPEDVQRGGFAQAGLRCVDLIMRNRTTARVPIIINTVLDDEDVAVLVREESSPFRELPAGVQYVHKGDDGQKLVATARRLLQSRG